MFLNQKPGRGLGTRFTCDGIGCMREDSRPDLKAIIRLLVVAKELIIGC